MYIIFMTIIPLLLEGIFSFYIPPSSLFYPLPTLLSVCFCQVYFLKHKNYIWYAFLIGTLYDIAYTNTLFLHALLFVCMSYIYQKLSHFFPHTWYHFLLVITLLIGLYRTITYVVLLSIGYLKFHFSSFIAITMASFLWNLIYGLFLYGMDHLILKKFTSKRLF